MTSVAVGARRASGEAGPLAIVAAVAPPLWRDAEATTRGHVAQGSLSGLGVVETTGDAGRLAGKLLVESGASVVRLGPAFGGPAMADPTVAERRADRLVVRRGEGHRARRPVQRRRAGGLPTARHETNPPLLIPAPLCTGVIARAVPADHRAHVTTLTGSAAPAGRRSATEIEVPGSPSDLRRVPLIVGRHGTRAHAIPDPKDLVSSTKRVPAPRGSPSTHAGIATQVSSRICVFVRGTRADGVVKVAFGRSRRGAPDRLLARRSALG